MLFLSICLCKLPSNFTITPRKPLTTPTLSQKAALEATLIHFSNEYVQTTSLFLLGDATAVVEGRNFKQSITKQYFFCERLKQ